MSTGEGSCVRRALRLHKLGHLIPTLLQHKLLDINSREDIVPAEFIRVLDDFGVDSSEVASLIVEIETQLKIDENAVNNPTGGSSAPFQEVSAAELPFRRQQEKVAAMLKESEEEDAALEGRPAPKSEITGSKQPGSFLPGPKDTLRPENSFKMLCLHGDFGNQGIADTQAKMVLELQRAGAELEYVDGPFDATPFTDDKSLVAYGRAWISQPPIKTEFALEAGARVLAEKCRKSGPYKVGYGFSQGASVLAYFCQERVWRGRFKFQAPPFEALIFASAADLPLRRMPSGPETEWEVLEIPTYHILGKRDWQLQGSLDFSARFHRPHLALHPFGHEVPVRLQGSPTYLRAVREFAWEPKFSDAETSEELQAAMMKLFERTCKDLKEAPDVTERLNEMASLKLRPDFAAKGKGKKKLPGDL